jgi:hypothetical protein
MPYALSLKRKFQKTAGSQTAIPKEEDADDDPWAYVDNE